MGEGRDAARARGRSVLVNEDILIDGGIRQCGGLIRRSSRNWRRRRRRKIKEKKKKRKEQGKGERFNNGSNDNDNV